MVKECRDNTLITFIEKNKYVQGDITPRANWIIRNEEESELGAIADLNFEGKKRYVVIS